MELYKQYKSKGGQTQYKPSFDWIEDAISSDNNIGFCLACATEIYGVEPDARKYECECCGEFKVYGAQELLIMGLYFE